MTDVATAPPSKRATATISRQRRARSESSWVIRIEGDDVKISGSVSTGPLAPDIAFEAAGWRALAVAEAVLDAVGLTATPTFDGLPPHPAAK